MFRHIVLSRFKAGTTDEQRLAFQRSIEAFRESCPTVRHLECGPNVGSGPNHYDFASVVDFDDRAGFRAYLEGAPHKAYVESLGRVVVEQMAVAQQEL